MATNRYRPCASVVVTSLAFVPLLTTCTFAPPITAPEESVTVPKMVPIAPCAYIRTLTTAVSRATPKAKAERWSFAFFLITSLLLPAPQNRDQRHVMDTKKAKTYAVCFRLLNAVAPRESE